MKKWNVKVIKSLFEKGASQFDVASWMEQDGIDKLTAWEKIQRTIELYNLKPKMMGL